LENNRTLQIPYIKIRNLNADVTNFLEAFKGYTDTLFYYSSYTEMMKHYMDNDGEFLRISVPDYPDSSKVDDYINDGFPDYLY
jgi:predicted membrane-bound dolichyl-phosphate-mannose-protein mannosyltransferase